MKTIIFLLVFIFSVNILFAQYYIIVNYSDGTERVTPVGEVDDINFSDFECGVATVDYAGKTYNTVQIGNQCWLKENLNVGVMIQSNQNQTNNSIIEKYCYNNLEENCTIYGGLYQWWEIMEHACCIEGAKGICPEGWHIPTYAEIQYLNTEVGGDGNSLKAIGQGSGEGAGTNTNGFSALLAGQRYIEGNFGDLGFVIWFWSSTDVFGGGSTAYVFLLLGYTSLIYLDDDSKLNGNSVRCIRD